MKIIAGVVVAVLVLFVMMVAASRPTPEVRAARQHWCALSPDTRELALALQWERERTRPGSPYHSLQDYASTIRRHMGC